MFITCQKNHFLVLLKINVQMRVLIKTFYLITIFYDVCVSKKYRNKLKTTRPYEVSIHSANAWDV